MKTQKTNLEDFAAIISDDNLLTHNEMNYLRGGDGGDVDTDTPLIYIKL